MGGLLGPGEAAYQSLGERWSARGVPVLRVSYRRPNDLDACCLDVAATVQMAVATGADRVVVMGTVSAAPWRCAWRSRCPRS
jgi:hypothetical protein